MKICRLHLRLSPLFYRNLVGVVQLKSQHQKKQNLKAVFSVVWSCVLHQMYNRLHILLAAFKTSCSLSALLLPWSVIVSDVKHQ